jgi:hypothetical protein
MKRPSLARTMSSRLVFAVSGGVLVPSLPMLKTSKSELIGTMFLSRRQRPRVRGSS